MKNKILIGIIGSIVGVALVASVCVVVPYNSMVTAEENVIGQFANVDAVLQRRYDLIPNLVSAAQGYMQHEEELFNSLAEARTRLAGAETVEDKIEASNKMESELSRLLLVVENYPELKSNETVTNLMDELAGTENRISVERNKYNEAVKSYNKGIKKFPKNIIANLFNFESKEYFEAADSVKDTPVVDLN